MAIKVGNSQKKLIRICKHDEKKITKNISALKRKETYLLDMEIETEGEAAVPIIEKNENRQSNNQSYKKETQRRSRSPARYVQSFIQSKI